MKKVFILFLIILLTACSQEPITPSPTKKIIFLHKTSTKDIVELEFEEYIKGVVLSEMPENFELEALKSQAVAARTYATEKLHNGIQLCDDPSHCQAWKDFNQNEKISEAVDSTKDQILTYNNLPIKALFHSSSNQKTEDAKEVWGSSIPYLIPVDSENEEKIMPTFDSAVSISYKNFSAKLNSFLKKENAITSDTNKLKNQTKILSKTSGDRISKIKVCQYEFTGTEFRKIFSLRSTSFDISFEKNSICFLVKGYGHGVGMSQWGAEYMAKSGKNYIEILNHYYPNTKLENISE